ncbi:uncharacterized protein LOC134241222 [Saccostrea cucullata]|uniref:uncharacterized protein LOC134241222 n=1 Tax=Saccostrea cuccullata TaxID=36930 RepID=UPI002ED1CE97
MNFLACIIILVTVYTETKALAKHDMEKELRALSNDVDHLKKAGKGQAEVIKQLQNIVEIQAARMSMLSEILQNQRQVKLQARERERTYNNKPAIQNHVEERGDLTRKYRLLSPVPTQSIPEETIAFYAYMSADMNGIGSHHTLGFDVVKTNEGNGFHGNTGVFNPPKSGLYVFSWTLRVVKGAHHSVELVVNHDVVGSTYHIENYSFDQGGATVVIFCNKGDDIYLRTGANYNVGPITSEERGRSSFAGWKL